MPNEDMLAPHRHWIGKHTERHDHISPRLIEQFRATFGLHSTSATPVPPGLFWCLSPDALTADHLGEDGHPRLGITMPEIPYPRRMWAGGKLRFHGEFLPDQMITKRSTIRDIVFKTGRSGNLCFVTVDHHYRHGDTLILEEEQNIVYREEVTPVAAASEITSIPTDAITWQVNPDSVQMFRYSALTFNGHRIHYDRDHSVNVEGHPGLVVHGPMQATWMLALATDHLGHLPTEMHYRGLAAYIEGAPATVAMASTGEEGKYDAMVVNADGIKTMQATVLS